MRLHRAFIIALASLAASCGFVMRGDAELPPVMEKTYIVYPGTDTRLLRTVARAVSLSGASIARHPETATGVLNMTGTVVQRRVVARDVRGRPSEYELVAILKFQVMTPEGEIVVPVQTVERHGTVVLDLTAPLANAGEIQNAVDVLVEDATWEMLARIAATVTAPEAVGTTEPVE